MGRHYRTLSQETSNLFAFYWMLCSMLTEICLAQYTFVLANKSPLNYRPAAAAPTGVILSECLPYLDPTTQVTRFFYLTVDQDRHVSAQITSRTPSAPFTWQTSQIYSSLQICDRKSNLVQIIGMPSTKYFYGLNVPSQVGSNCSSALLVWDLEPALNEFVFKAEYWFPEILASTASMVHATVSGNSYLVISSYFYYTVSSNSMGSIPGPKTLTIAHFAANSDTTFPVWGVDISSTALRIYSLAGIASTYSQLSISGLPSTSSGTLVGCRKLSGSSDQRMLLVTTATMFLVDSSVNQAYPLNHSTVVTGTFAALEIDPQNPTAGITVTRGGMLEAYTLVSSPSYQLQLVTQLNVSSLNLAARSIKYGGSSTLAAVSSTNNQLYFFTARVACDPACATCVGASDSDCIGCSTNHVRDPLTNTCKQCPPGSYSATSQTVCTPCFPGCESCPNIISSPSSECPVCFAGMKKKFSDPRGCVLCPSNGFYSYNSDYCRECDGSCRTCSNLYSYSCTGCYEGYYLLSSNCNACSIPYCASCDASGNCYKCKQGYFYTIDAKCAKCDDLNCRECFSSGLGKCNNCNDGYFADPIDWTCKPCGTNCSTCSDATTCDSCKSSFTLVRSSTAPATCQNCTTVSGNFLYFYQEIQYCDICNSNCLTCLGQATNCTGCADYFYLKNAECFDCPQNCSKCLDPYICTNCSSGTYLSSLNQTCTACGDNFFVDTNGLDCLPCNPVCTRCSSLAVCLECDTAANYYLNVSTCIHYSTLKATEGVDPTDNSVKPCLDANCRNCKPDYRVCLLCDDSASFYRYGDECRHVSNFTPNQGIALLNLTVQDCLESHCTNCTDNYQICRRCDFQNNWYLNLTAACVEVTNIPAGQGINAANSSILPCGLEHCDSCAANFSVCLACNSTDSFYLVNETCRLSLVQVLLNPVPPKTSAHDLAFELLPQGGIADPTVVPAALSVFQLNSSLQVVFVDSNNNQTVNASFKETKEAGAAAAGYFISISQYLPERQYRVSVSLSRMSFVHSDGTTYYISAASASTTYDNPVDLVQAKVLKQQQAAGQLLSSVAPGSSPAAGSITLAVIAMDPTGTFFRFTKMLQILGRLYHLNINFGKRLDAFLLKTASGEKANPDDLVRHSRQTRGKLSTHLVPLDSVRGQLLWKICLYWCLWFLWVASLLVQRSPKLYKSKAMIYFTFLLSRAHWAVFNLIFGELLWLLPRTVLHSRRLSFGVYFGTAVTFPLVVCDFVYLLRLISSRERWGRFAVWASPNFTEKKLPAKAQAKTEVKADVPNPENQPQTKQINYKKTYFEIGCNFPLMEMVSGSFIPREIIGDSLACRYLCLSPWFRLVFIQLLISSCQYASHLAVSLMLVNEYARIIIALFVLLEYKIYKTKMHFVADVLQSAFLVVWLSICLLLSAKRFDETVSDSLQDTGVWVLLIACLVDYVVLLVFCGMGIYSFCKTKRLTNKMKILQISPSIITFSTAKGTSRDSWIRFEKLNKVGSESGPSTDLLHSSNRTGVDQRNKSFSISEMSSDRAGKPRLPLKQARKALQHLNWGRRIAPQPRD